MKNNANCLSVRQTLFIITSKKKTTKNFLEGHLCAFLFNENIVLCCLSSCVKSQAFVCAPVTCHCKRNSFASSRSLSLVNIVLSSRLYDALLLRCRKCVCCCRYLCLSTPCAPSENCKRLLAVITEPPQLTELAVIS